MDSSGNSNQPPPPFEMKKLFKPTNPNNLSSNLNNPNPQFPQSSYPPPTSNYSYPPHHHQHQYLPYPQQDQFTNIHHQQNNPIPYPMSPSSQLPPHLQSPNPNLGASARLMALIGSQPQPNLEFPPQSMPPQISTVSSLPGNSEFSVPPLNPRMLVEMPSSAPPVNLNNAQPTPVRLPSRKVPMGRHLVGDHVEYDVDIRLQGEIQPQLEVTPITKYTSDPGLVVGRQIAVSKTYICYGLKTGAIRILNINTALRSLLKGHTQRVTDMAFFAEDVHILASASMDGKVFVWNISEGSDDLDKPQITGKIVTAIQIVGVEETVHPRVCWHSHKQEFLIVGIGKHVLKIDMTKVGRGKVFSPEEPLNCPVDKLIAGVQLIGEHDEQVTDLSMCQWMTSRLASASKDGTVKIWEDRKASPLLVLRPHDGHPVHMVAFLTASHSPGHINLITAGPLNREVRIWASASQEGWLLPSDAESWQCTQTLVLKSSAESRVEEAFFNQVVALPQSGLVLLANAKKNAIYAVHVENGPNPAATRMDYIAEFTVTMPILSLTGTSDSLPDGGHVVQVYCVQTLAIQQYALDLSRCLPSPENDGLQKTDSSVSHTFERSKSDGFAPLELSTVSTPTGMTEGVGFKPPTVISSSGSAPVAKHPVIMGAAEVSDLRQPTTSSMEPRQSALPPGAVNFDNVHVASPPLPLSPRMSRKLSGFRNTSNTSELDISDSGVDQSVQDFSIERRLDTVPTKLSNAASFDDNSRNDERKTSQNDNCVVLNPSVMFTQPTHLISPSEISKVIPSSEKVQDMVVNNDPPAVELEVNVVEETGPSCCSDVDSHRKPIILDMDKNKKTFSSQVSDLNIEMTRECCALSTESVNMEENRQVGDAGTIEPLGQPADTTEEKTQDPLTDVSGKDSESTIVSTFPQPSSPKRVKQHKGVSGAYSPSSSPFNSTGSSNESSNCASDDRMEMVSSQMLSIQEALNQCMTTQQEIQKQNMKEGKRVEAALGRNIEKFIKSNSDALWARMQEECTKREKIERDRTQQITTLISNCMNKDLPALLERILKKELAMVGPAVTRLITPTVEKIISSSIAEAFQRGVGDKAVNQLEKSVSAKLETAVAWQIQAQFQSSGKQALQDALMSSLEGLVIPAFEMSCKSMFEQVDGVFQKGLSEHTTTVLKQLESTHSPLAHTLRGAINSATSITQSLTVELADGQRKLIALAAAGANSNAVNPLVSQSSNGPMSGIHEMVEAVPDPTKELSRLISEHKFEEAFNGALQRSDVSIVSWLCSQVDLQSILSMVPLPLSQGVLLALLQQLAYDINKETSRRLTWMRDVAVAINPLDPMIVVHVRPIFEQVYQILGHHRIQSSTTPSEANSIRLLMHVINSMLTSCK